jgi:hypothetical protein
MISGSSVLIQSRVIAPPALEFIPELIAKTR